MQSLCTGISAAYTLYAENADAEQMKKWQTQFMWYFVNRAFSKIKYLKSDDELNAARETLVEVDKTGAFDTVPNEWFELRNRIYEFIKK